MRPRTWAAVCLAICLGALTLWLAIYHRLVLERLLTDLVLPTGLIWIGLVLVTVLAARAGQRPLAYLAGTLWVVHTIAGTGFVANLLTRSLELPFAHIVPLEQAAFDAVVVLGGASEVGLNGQSQMNRNGDRIALAARMYHAGKTQRIVVTGQRASGLSADPTDPAQQAYELLVQLGVPSDRIERVRGRNTEEEVQQLAAILPNHHRLGLITSAWHLRRALRLADGHGLRFEPLPSSFQSASTVHPIAADLVPDVDSYQQFTTAVREYLARLVGR